MTDHPCHPVCSTDLLWQDALRRKDKAHPVLAFLGVTALSDMTTWCQSRPDGPWQELRGFKSMKHIGSRTESNLPCTLRFAGAKVGRPVHGG
jgi:hypothetical protein